MQHAGTSAAAGGPNSGAILMLLIGLLAVMSQAGRADETQAVMTILIMIAFLVFCGGRASFPVGKEMQTDNVEYADRVQETFMWWAPRQTLSREPPKSMNRP